MSFLIWKGGTVTCLTVCCKDRDVNTRGPQSRVAGGQCFTPDDRRMSQQSRVHVNE